MDIRDEIQKVLIEFSEGEVYINKATDDILSLSNVVGQSEQLCECKCEHPIIRTGVTEYCSICQLEVNF